MLSTLLITFSIILFLCIIQYHWKRSKLYRIAAKHNGPIPLPIIGNALAFTGSNEDKLRKTMNVMATYKSPITIWFGQHLFFAITDAKHLDILLNNSNALEKEDFLYQHFFPLLGNSLLNAPVSMWTKHRKLIMPTFNKKILDGYVETFSEQAAILNTQLEKKVGPEEFDIHQYLCLFSLDSICETAMGITIEAQTTRTPFASWFCRCSEIMFHRMFVFWYHFDFIFNLTSMAADFKYNCDKLRTFVKNIITQRREAHRRQSKDINEAQVEEVTQRNITFLQKLIEISEAGDYLTDTEILDEVIFMTLAGADTTATANSFTTVMLGMHPNIQEKVYMEVIETIGYDRAIEHTDLPKLQYLEMVIKETLRLFPVAPFVVRAISNDIRLDEDAVIPAGSAVMLGIIQAHRDPKVWPDPLRFDPLRFLPEECAKRNPCSYLPFSVGPRNCIGLKYAMMSMKTVIASVIRKYRIETKYKCVEEIKLKQDMFLKPVDGFFVSLEIRT